MYQHEFLSTVTKFSQSQHQQHFTTVSVHHFRCLQIRDAARPHVS